MYAHDSLVIKTIYYIVNVMFTEAELFAIRYEINQATHIPNINQIAVITYFIYTTKRIFDSSLHPYLIYSSAISCKLKEFFEYNSNNFIEFWDCPSSYKWSLYAIVDKETKNFDLTSIYSCKSL